MKAEKAAALPKFSDTLTLSTPLLYLFFKNSGKTSVGKAAKFGMGSFNNYGYKILPCFDLLPTSSCPRRY